MRVMNVPDDLPISDGEYTSCQFARRQVPEPWPFDPTMASRLLEESGWVDLDGDRVRERRGRQFRFTVTTSGIHESALVVAQEMLRRIGVRMEIQLLTRELVRQEFLAGDFEAITQILFTKETFGENSPSGYNNSRLIELFSELEYLVDREEIDRVYREISEIFREDIPGTFLFPRVTVNIARRTIHGFEGIGGYGPIAHLDRLWVEDED